MTDTILATAVNLLKDVCVVVVVAYIVTRTPAYARVLDRRASFRDRLLLMLVFGAFSVWGTLSGSRIMDAVASTRDLGPTMGGLAAGPFVGIGAGLIGALQRLTMGGPTCLPCSLATLLIGVAAGLVYVLRRGRFLGVAGSVVFVAVAETAHMGLVLLMVQPFSEAFDIARTVYLPMLLSNCAGVAVFALIFTNRERERATAAAKRRVDAELATARAIQLGMLPTPVELRAASEAAGFSVAAVLEPARDVGGDLYDVFLVDDERVCLVIGDVAGKGVPAALFMAAADALVRAEASAGREPDEILTRVNEELCRRNEALMFVTLFVGVVHLSTGELVYGSGGHCPPLVRRASGGVEALPRVAGAALAIARGLRFEVGRLALARGDALLLYTDGVTEAADGAERLFGDERLEESLATLDDASPPAVIERIMSDVSVFVAGAERSDDIAMVVFRYEEGAGAQGASGAHGRSARLPAQLSAVARLAELVDEFARHEALPAAVAHDVVLVAEEAFTNVARHGGAAAPGAVVEVALRRDGDEVTVSLADEGPPFDPTSVPPPDVSGGLEAREPGGLGIHVMRTLCRTIDYQRRDGRNVLTLVMTVAPGEGSE